MTKMWLSSPYLIHKLIQNKQRWATPPTLHQLLNMQFHSKVLWLRSNSSISFDQLLLIVSTLPPSIHFQQEKDWNPLFIFLTFCGYFSAFQPVPSPRSCKSRHHPLLTPIPSTVNITCALISPRSSRSSHRNGRCIRSSISAVIVWRRIHIRLFTFN